MFVDRFDVLGIGLNLHLSDGSQVYLSKDLLEEHEDEIAELMGWEDPPDDDWGEWKSSMPGQIQFCGSPTSEMSNTFRLEVNGEVTEFKLDFAGSTEENVQATIEAAFTKASQAGRDAARDFERLTRECFQAGWVEADETLTQTWAPQTRNCGTCSHWNMLHLMCKLSKNVGERKEKDVCSDWDNYKKECEPEKCDSCKGSCGADEVTDDDMLDYDGWIRKIYQDMSVQTFLAMPLPDKRWWMEKKLHAISLRYMVVEGGQETDLENRARMHRFLIHYGCNSVHVAVDPSGSGVNLFYELPQ